MKNFIIQFLSFLSINFAAAQLAGGPTIDYSLPKVAPASPTVAAMMKFEEVPVNNYTGIPDISIPLYSTPTHSKDIALNLSLNYHPAAAAASEVASYVGLGWSFFAGGTISRTVKGLPDDTTETGKYGMWNGANKYDQVTGLLGNADTAEEREIINEYMWEASQKGKYDTEYDLFQYNFMGYSGRFYINKNHQVVKLDTSTLRIIYDRFEQTFTIFDDKGYKYFFDIKETTTQSGLTRTTFIDNTIEDTNTPETSFISAFHLSKICNIKPIADPQAPNAQQDDVLVSYTYNTGSPIYEFTKTSTQTDILMTSANRNAVRHLIEGTDCPDIQGALRMIEPISINSGQSLNILTRKLQSISVKDFVKIEFVTEAGRLDYNLTNPEGANKLKEIIIKEYNTNTIVKKFTLYYDYSNPASKGKRLILTEVKETNYKNSVADAQTFSHKLSYNKSAFAIVNYSSDDIGKDYWGYFNFTPSSNRFNKETSSGACTIDLLQKMTLPTGGCILYRFEANTYSYVGSTVLTNFDENPDNWTSSDGELSFSNSPNAAPSANATPKMLPFSTNPQYITFIPAPMPGDGSGFQLLESLPVNGVHSINGPYQAVSSLNCSFSGCTLDYTLAGGKYYKVSYGYFTLGETYSAVMHYKNKLRENPTRKWLYGGGIRIKKIGYFEDDAVAASFYEVYSSSNTGITPIKEKNYNYQFFDDVWRSSGSLASAKPNFSYILTKKHGIRCAYAALTVDAYTYDYNTSFNNIQAAGTQGGAVGYQNVTVKEIASPKGIEVSNGRQEFTYYSPIDEPDAEEAYSNSYPFVSHANYDYRRGLLRFEKILNNDNEALVETTYGYEKDAKNPITTGIRFFTPSGSNCPYSNQFVSYIQYKSRVDMCPPGSTPPICIYQCGEPLNFISYTYASEAFGWSRLTSKTTKEYFYNGATQNGTLETTQNYTYNTTNHLIETNELVTYSGTTPEKVKSKYYYFNSPENINRISEVEKIETFKNGVLTGTQNIVFSNTIGTSWFSPSIIQSAKGTQTLEDRLQIKKYDAFGNVLEVKQAGGLPVSYIYGYNNTKPIAMIEGAGYDSFSPITSYITAAQNASNTDTGDVPTDGTLTPLMTALVNLRTQMAANLSMTHMITTYTYQPLKGVTSVTDPKGSITSYTYDMAGRLIMVRDETGKILSENKYNYRP